MSGRWGKGAGRAALAIALLGGLAWWAPWRGASAPGTAPASPASTTERGSVEGRGGPAPATASIRRTRLPPLPPAGLPLEATAPALLARADAGDPVAACRLGEGLLRCRDIAAWEAADAKAGTDMAESFARSGNLRAAVAIDEQRLWRLEQLAHCGALDEKLKTRGGEFLARAARAGNRHAMVAYASGIHFDHRGGYAASREFDDWRRDSPGMLQRALQAGEPSAVMLLLMAYQDDSNFAAALIPDDPERAYAFHLLANRLFGYTVSDEYARTLDAAAMRRARELARQMHERHFGGRRFDGKLAHLLPPALQRPDDYPQDPCVPEA